ncbi:lipid-A-disaccharide synthase [Roseivirga sp. BDSF3-8]|uniref:lipid-A-disaccharide synthase n=1 Tax=Roseivirga sp. BDSF3-8 TaxID=3241598 RepID=UPI003531E115
MRYYIIAGERSGDLHGGELIKYLMQMDPDAQIRGWGGDGMKAAGMKLVKHYRETAFMGVWEVLINLRKIRSFLKECKKDIRSFAPDAIVLIDYPGFNLRIAAFAKSLGVPVHYYISPKVWAWNTKRAKKIKRFVDKLYVIFPFEVDFFRKYEVGAIFVGNPLISLINDYSPSADAKILCQKNDQIIAVLPGSRYQEVKSMLDVMLQVVDQLPDFHFVVAAVSNLPVELYDAAMEHPSVTVLTDSAYDILSYSKAAIVTSGTATLETALFSVPQVVCYKTSAFTYSIAKKVIKVPFISLVNIVAEKEVVKELIQNDFTPSMITKELQSLVDDTSYRRNMLNEYSDLKKRLGKKNAPLEVAEQIVNSLT